MISRLDGSFFFLSDGLDVLKEVIKAYLIGSKSPIHSHIFSVLNSSHLYFMKNIANNRLFFCYHFSSRVTKICRSMTVACPPSFSATKAPQPSASTERSCPSWTAASFSVCAARCSTTCPRPSPVLGTSSPAGPARPCTSRWPSRTCPCGGRVISSRARLPIAARSSRRASLSTGRTRICRTVGWTRILVSLACSCALIPWTCFPEAVVCGCWKKKNRSWLLICSRQKKRKLP